MNGTNGDIPSSADREPLPFLAEVQDRQRDIAMRGAEPWNDPLEDRRAARRPGMEMPPVGSPAGGDPRPAPPTPPPAGPGRRRVRGSRRRRPLRRRAPAPRAR